MKKIFMMIPLIIILGFIGQPIYADVPDCAHPSNEVVVMGIDENIPQETISVKGGNDKIFIVVKNNSTLGFHYIIRDINNAIISKGECRGNSIVISVEGGNIYHVTLTWSGGTHSQRVAVR